MLDFVKFVPYLCRAVYTLRYRDHYSRRIYTHHYKTHLVYKSQQRSGYRPAKLRPVAFCCREPEQLKSRHLKHLSNVSSDYNFRRVCGLWLLAHTLEWFTQSSPSSAGRLFLSRASPTGARELSGLNTGDQLLRMLQARRFPCLNKSAPF